MKKKIIRKILIIITLFMIFAVAYSLINTYAIFYSEGTGKIRQENATWRIYVNEKNIATNNKFTIDTFELEESEHVAPGKIAPSVTGNFYITIDPKNTNVAIKYSIKLNQLNLVNDKIKIVSIEEINQKNELIKTDESTYTGIITLSDIKEKKINNIRVKITWLNDEENNKADTTMGTIENYKINIPIEVDITQYLGETIEEYTL
jgi:hypothetical protein